MTRTSRRSKDTPPPPPHDDNKNVSQGEDRGRQRGEEEPSENPKKSQSSEEDQDSLYTPRKRPSTHWKGQLRLYSPSPINNAAKYTDFNFPLVSMLDKHGKGYDGGTEITGIMQCCFDLYKEVYEGFVVNLLSEDPRLCMKIIPKANLPVHLKEREMLERRVTRGQRESMGEGKRLPFTPTVLWNRLKSHFYSYEDMCMICGCFNEAAKVSAKNWNGFTRPDQPDQYEATPEFLQRFMSLLYTRAVTDTKALDRGFKAYSSQTYGETSFNMVQEIIASTTPTKADSFLDLGSGIGNVVLHMTAAKKLRSCVGIEISAIPIQYAKQMKKEFYRWLPFFGKWTRNSKLLEGNFLDPKFDHYFDKATIILVNNYKFDDNLNNLLADKFFNKNLSHGVRIISTKPFCRNKERLYQHNARISQRLESIMDVEELPLIADCVSWTSRPFRYYLHTVNLNKTFLLSSPLALAPPPPHSTNRTTTKKRKDKKHVRRMSSLSSVSFSAQDSPQSREIEKKLAAFICGGGEEQGARKKKTALQSLENNTTEDNGLILKKRKLLPRERPHRDWTKSALGYEPQEAIQYKENIQLKEEVFSDTSFDHDPLIPGPYYPWI